MQGWKCIYINTLHRLRYPSSSSSSSSTIIHLLHYQRVSWSYLFIYHYIFNTTQLNSSLQRHHSTSSSIPINYYQTKLSQKCSPQLSSSSPPPPSSPSSLQPHYHNTSTTLKPPHRYGVPSPDPNLHRSSRMRCISTKAGI